MRLIEKKCPNCGAKLSFGDSDKSCKCEFCKTGFEIERNENSENNNIEEQYDLTEMKGLNKFMRAIIFAMVIFGIIVIGIIFYQIFNNFGV